MARLERVRHAGAESADVARLQAQLESAQSLAGAHDGLLALVKQDAGEELAQRGGQLVELLTAHLGNALTQAGADDAERKRAVAELVAPMNQTLVQLKERLDKVDAGRERTERELTAQLRTVTSGQQDVARSAAAPQRWNARCASRMYADAGASWGSAASPSSPG